MSAVYLKTIIVGGSNTVIAGGYIESTVRASAVRGIDLDIVVDLSVGNTTIGYGLLQLDGEPALKTCDLLIIEYAINDEFAYATSVQMLRFWNRLHEAILRKALSVNPKLRVVIVHLSTRTGDWTSGISELAARSCYLADYYGACFVDVNRALMTRFGERVVGHADFYVEGDSAHYARPFSTAMIGDVVAGALADWLAREPPRPARLPSPIDSGEVSSACVIPLDLIAAAVDRPVKRYKNWRFSIAAVNVAGLKLDITLRGGVLLGVEYVCESCTVDPVFDTIKGSVRVSSMKFGVRNGVYKFLISYLPTEFLFPLFPDLAVPPAEHVVTLRTRGDHDHDYVPRDGTPFLSELKSNEDGVFPLGRVLYTGTLVNVRLGS